MVSLCINVCPQIGINIKRNLTGLQRESSLSGVCSLKYHQHGRKLTKLYRESSLFNWYLFVPVYSSYWSMLHRNDTHFKKYLLLFHGKFVYPYKKIKNRKHNNKLGWRYLTWIHQSISKCCYPLLGVGPVPTTLDTPVEIWKTFVTQLNFRNNKDRNQIRKNNREFLI